MTDSRQDPHAFVDDAVRRIRDRAGRRRPHGLWLPLIVIGMGVIFLLDQLSVYPADRAFQVFWPAILIVAGLEYISFNRPGRFPLFGAGLLTVGVLLMMENLGYMSFHVGNLWPLILIAVGLGMLFRRRGVLYCGGWGPYSSRTVDRSASNPSSPSPAAPFNISGDPDATLDCHAVLGGVKRRVTAQDFQGGRLTAFLGGFEVDLTHANIAGEKAMIETNALFGGGEIRVPETWQIDLQGQAILGGFSDETHQIPPTSGVAKRLIITGTAAFGGVVIKN